MTALTIYPDCCIAWRKAALSDQWRLANGNLEFMRAQGQLLSGVLPCQTMEFSKITEAERRSLGRFDTPRPLAQALTDWAVRHANETVLEPSCGGGVIVASILARLKEFGAKKPSQQIWACDIDPRALKETKRAVKPHAPHLVLGNFLSAAPSEFGGKKFSVILGNPPYVRLHTMDGAARDAARKSLPTPNLLDAKASLWAYFPIHAFKMLAAGGRMGWIVPETVLHSEYGKQFLGWAKQNFQKCVAVSLRERCFLADGAKERIVVLLLEGAGGQAAREIEMVEFTSAHECIAALPGLGHPQAPALPQLNGHAVPHLVSNFAAQTAQAMETSADLKRFGDFADVKIGVVTGDNGFFLLNEEQREAAGLNHVDHALVHQRAETDGRARIIREHQESARIRDDAAMQRHAVHRRGHAMLADAVIDIAAGIIRRVEGDRKSVV